MAGTINSSCDTPDPSDRYVRSNAYIKHLTLHSDR
jgi:hypothetical protein